MVSVRPSSYGCTWEAAKHERSVIVAEAIAECISSFLRLCWQCYNNRICLIGRMNNASIPPFAVSWNKDGDCILYSIKS